MASVQPQIQLDVEHNGVTATFHRNLYPLPAVYGAAYVFIDRCYVFLDLPDAEHTSVALRGRGRLDEGGLQALAGELANELLGHAWRQAILEANHHIIETVTTQALAGALGGFGADDRGGPREAGGREDGPGPAAQGAPSFDEAAGDVFDDPLGIAVPWEEKYKQGEGAAVGGAAAAGDAAPPPGPGAADKKG